MSYVKFLLSLFAAVVLAFLVLLWPAFGKNTGIDVRFFSLMGASLRFWAIVVAFLGVFLATSRIANRWLRAGLFWVPATSLSALGVALASFLSYVLLGRHS